MRILGCIIAACIILAILRAAAAVLLLALLIGVLISLISRPKETIGLVLLAVVLSNPALVWVIVGLVLIAGLRSWKH